MNPLSNCVTEGLERVLGDRLFFPCSGGDDVDLLQRDKSFQVTCKRSRSGYMSIGFCRYCRVDCELAGKRADEIRAMRRR